MATRVTFVSGTAEVKRREPKDAVEEPVMMATESHMTGDKGNPYHTRQLDHSHKVVEEKEEMMVSSTGYVTGDRGNPHYSRSLDERRGGGIELVPPAQTVNYVDGKCTCCPYGYHIDLDFVNFCQDVNDGSTLNNLKRIQRAKRNLRKSMEVMLHQQQQHGDSATATLAHTPPDVVHSTEASRLVNMVQYEQTATHQVLRDIDTSVNATLASIDTVQQRKGAPQQPRYTSSDSEDGYSYSPVSPVSIPYQQQPHYNTLPTPTRHTHTHRRSGHYHHSNGEESSHFATSLSTSGRTDSMSSLSSVSTVSSEQVTGQYTSYASGMLNTTPHETATAEMRLRSEPHYTTVSATAMTSEKLAAAMATHFPQGMSPDEQESPSSLSPDTTIGKASLTAIREAMAVSLRRMRDLEEQVKAIPILQVRISVLKEEKRLLALQLKAKAAGGANVRSIGVGDGSVDSPLTPSQKVFSFPMTSSTISLQASSPLSPSMRSPPATLPKPSRVKTIGVGDHSVVEPYLLQPDLPTGYTIFDNQVHTEIRTTILEKETMFLDGGSLDRRLAGINRSSAHTQRLGSHQDLMESQTAVPAQTHFTINQIQRSAPRPLTRSIGVGEGNVHDSSLQIHEKELRTVILGGSGATVGKRNVGIEVRVPTRSVGVSYSCDDDRPATRTVGVNVSYDTSNILTSLDFKGESELRTALRGVLQRNVRSIGTTCDFSPEVMDTGVQHESFNMVSVGCGGEDCRVDIDIRQPVTQRSLGMMAKPETTSRVSSTDKDWVLDRGTNTMTVEMYNKACSTDSKRMGTVATNTEYTMRRGFATQTEMDVFQGLQVIQHAGTNTIPCPTMNRSSNTLKVFTSNRGVNTKSPDLIMENFDFQITFDDKSVNTPKEFCDAAVNTSSKELRLSFTKVESLDLSGDEIVDPPSPQRPLTMQEQIIKRGASQASAFLGSTSSSSDLSPTSPRGQPSMSENESMTKTVKETVYISPSSHHSVVGRLTERSDGSDLSLRSANTNSSMQSEIVRHDSGGLLESSSGGGAYQFSGDLGGNSGGGFSRSTITRTITTSGGAGDRADSVDGNQRSMVTRTVTTSGGGIGSGFSSQFGGGDGNQGNIVTKKTIVMSSGTGGGASSLDGNGERQITRTVITGGGGGGSGYSSLITRTMSSDNAGGDMGSSFEGDGNFQRNVITKTIVSGGGTGGGFDADAGSHGSRSVVTKMVTRSGGIGGGFDADADSHGTRSVVTKTVSRSGGTGDFDGDGSTVRKVTQTITTSGTGGASTNRSELRFKPSSGGDSGLAMEEGWSGTKRIQMQDLTGGSSYMERFGYAKTPKSSTMIVKEQTPKSSTMIVKEQTGIVESSTAGVTDGNVSGANVEVVEGTAVLESSGSASSLQSGQVKLIGGNNAETNSLQSFSSVSSGNLQGMSSEDGDIITEKVIKRTSSGGRLSKNRHSDGARLSRELALGRQGAFSGRRVGSVEDFMPDNMRRFMNIETVGSGSKSQSCGNLSKPEMTVTKSTRTVTTKRVNQDGKSTVTVTRTITNPDGSVTTISDSDLDTAGTGSEGTSLSKLSSGQFDLSSIAGEDSSASSQSSQEISEGGGMKDSGCYDSSTMSSVSASSSLQGLDLSAMGSLERKQIKSIMKRSKSDTANPKKGISFAESVVGGTGSSTEEEEGTESDESTTSYDEGSYDGREGDITYQCQDDEAIAQGLPGAKMYDQNIRETYELSDEMRQACSVLASYLVDSTTIQTKELNTNLSVVQEEWFRVSSHKLSSVHQVEDYLNSINEISHRLLDYIVNLVDNNGNAAIHYCVSHCNFDIVGLLLDTEVCDVKRPNKAGYTPAMLASLAHVQNEDHREAIRRLFAAGDINARAEKTGQTALMLATSQCRADMVQLLLEAGADCNLQDFDGSTALMCASEHGHTAIAQLLLAQPDCDANLTDNENSSALSIAMEAGHKDLGVILYKHLNFSKPASPTHATLALKQTPSPKTVHQLLSDMDNSPETEV